MSQLEVRKNLVKSDCLLKFEDGRNDDTAIHPSLRPGFSFENDLGFRGRSPVAPSQSNCRRGAADRDSPCRFPLQSGFAPSE